MNQAFIGDKFLSFGESAETSMQAKGKATLTLDSDGASQSFEFPIYGGSVGPNVIDIRSKPVRC